MGSTRERNRPRYNRCDYCGRNPHKVATRSAAGIVKGWCPSCYRGTVPTNGPNGKVYRIPRWAYDEGEGTIVLYDRRRRTRQELVTEREPRRKDVSERQRR